MAINQGFFHDFPGKEAEMREKLFRALALLVTRHTGKVIIGCIIVTIALVAVSGRLTMKTQLADMMPEGIPQIAEFTDIVDEYKSAMTVMLTIESPSKDAAAMKRCADDLASRLDKITMFKPHDQGSMNLSQKIAYWRGKYPIPGVSYDTLRLVNRIDYKIDREFIEKSGMIIQKTGDLENMTGMYNTLSLPQLIKNINDNFEKEYIDDSDNLSSLDGEAQAVQGLEGMRKYIAGIGSYIADGDSSKAAESVRAFISGDQYFISPDNTMLLMMLQPAVSMDEFEDAMFLGYRIDDTLSDMQQRYPDLSLGRSGAMMIQIDENNALAKDFGWSSVIALFLILVLLVGSFRTWKNPFLSVVTLAVALMWTTGIIALILHYINMMSAAFALILIGLGIDFGIHVISGFRDGREQGMPVEKAISYMFNRSGTGIVTGALTTAIVFYILIFTRFDAFGEMGIAIGTGIITALLAMLLLLPALIVRDNKGYSITGAFLRKAGLGFIGTGWNFLVSRLHAFFGLPVFKVLTGPLQFGFLNRAGAFTAKTPVAAAILLISTVLVVLSVKSFTGIRFEYDMMKMEPVGIPSSVCQDRILDKFEISPDFSMVRARNLDECRRMVEEFKTVGNRTGLIGSIDAITEFLPETDVQRANIPIIESFRRRLDSLVPAATFTGEDAVLLEEELVRLHQNIVEIGELSVMGSGENNKIIDKCDQIVGKSDRESGILKLAETIRNDRGTASALGEFQMIMGTVMKKRLTAMASTEIVTLDNLPHSIKKRYVNDRSDALLINVFPKYYVWEEKQLRKFNEVTSDVSDRITGMPMLAMLMIDMMKEKGTLAVILGAVAITIFLLIDFRSIRYTVLAMIPLAVGTIWMVGLMALFRIQFSMASFMALPLIIGIGIDDGVHILHRYRIEGPGSMPLVIRFTGRAILLTSLTTMIGFGSIGLASHRGMAGMGQILFLGVGTCFITSAFVLPSVITLMDRITNGKFSKKGANGCRPEQCNQPSTAGGTDVL